MGLKIRDALMLSMLCVVSMGVVTRTAHAEKSSSRPDFSGIWQALNSAEWNLEPHEGRPGIPAGMGVVEGGSIPYQPWAAAKRQENFANRAKEDPRSKCFLPGVPRATYMGLPFQILQNGEVVLLFYEYAHAFRRIPIGAMPFNFDGAEFWMGESRGRFEGNTLIVESRNFNDASWLDAAGNFHSEALRVTERYTKTEPNLIMYEAQIEDPKVFTRPWKISMPLYRRREPNIQLLEYECYSFPGFEPVTGPPASVKAPASSKTSAAAPATATR